MKIPRDIPTRVIRPGEAAPGDDWQNTTADERIAAVWDITKTCYGWNHTDEPRLQRHITRTIRP